MTAAPAIQLLDIIPMSPKETFLVGHFTGTVKPGKWELRINGEALTTVEVIGEAEIEAGRKGKLTPPRVVVCRGPVEKSRIDFTRDEVTLVQL
ncbi:hypothetical protein SAMN06265337_0834 [Hymenobacter gelipurpurascens]|uniref:Uncharacterized protein n=1 Tax=Hymenobacter gelipurpurascens TaxID=89968 RepID=A0A212TB11_9BACT|nr:hypothetical protein [Hymenobacter gelipurpurascens]SNC63238.1 hypothetical protein SAMN06265337_0834 [Hymenobacter gelipurpurascens]